MNAEKIEAYQSAVIAAVLCAKMLAQHDLPQILRDIAHADAVGPIVDPTLWIKGQKAMREDAELLRAALPLWRKARELRPGSRRASLRRDRRSDDRRSLAGGAALPKRGSSSASASASSPAST